MSASTSISRRVFEALGHKLAQLSAKDTIQTKPLADIDFDSLQQALSNDKNAFHEHIPKLSKKLLGKTPFGSYTKMATSIIPKTSFDKATDAVFSQVGKLAQNWANFDLARDARFKDTLVASERQALARSIGDQNRALATLGGLSNLAGLPGILVDTMWLLAVCLRTIFQISAIYDRPLTGQQGIAIAYEILAKVDLNKLQEKQTLLAGLGIFEAMTDQSIEEYRAAVLAEEDSQSAMGILTKLEELSTQFNINIEQFNFGFLHKVIPLTAVGLGTAYNNIIINEVIEIAMSVFAPAPKLTHTTEE
ncbi:MAG: EcsC family protein [Moraxella sp.]